MGPETSDDAGVYRLGNLALVQTVDFFTPIVDDPYLFGQIAAANALSDIYAMGARPLTVLNLVAFPLAQAASGVLEQVLLGGAEKVAEAGAVILGGHTIEDDEPKYGLAVTGVTDPDRVLTNATARPGDALILTKPLGTGIIATAAKAGLASEVAVLAMHETMRALNKPAAEVMARHPVNACTDITGFGFLGHLSEMTAASHLGAVVFAGQIPALPTVAELIAMGMVPAGAYHNREFYACRLAEDSLTPEELDLLFDPQTSGGLLISLPEEAAESLLHDLQGAGVAAAWVGRMADHPGKKIQVRR